MSEYFHEVLRLLKQGKTVKEIAKVINKSERTIMDKLREEGYGKDGDKWYKRDEQAIQEAKDRVWRSKNKKLLGEWLSSLRILKREKVTLTIDVSTDIHEILKDLEDLHNLTKNEILALGVVGFNKKYGRK